MQTHDVKAAFFEEGGLGEGTFFLLKEGSPWRHLAVFSMISITFFVPSCSGSASMARTYDIEIQIPSMNGYKEVSSVSNARDYQARRGSIRFRRNATGKTEFVHTLNGSGLATSRILPALVEQNQNSDGSVNVPDVLKKYVGVDVIK